MVSLNQSKMCGELNEKGWKAVDLYAATPLIQRPIPGIILYVDPTQKIYRVNGDGSITRMKLVEEKDDD